MNRILEQNNDVQIYFEFWPHGLWSAGCHPESLLCYLRDKGFRLFCHHGKEGAIEYEIQSELKREQFINLYARR